MKFWITGDCHRNFNYIFNNPELMAIPKEERRRHGIILLGDAGINYTLDYNDDYFKKYISNEGFCFYLVRGNHEENPSLMSSMEYHWDSNVCNDVYLEDEYPLIRYLIDGKTYHIEGHKCLILGGAYSVDKFYRLARHGIDPNNCTHEECAKAGWFSCEQMTKRTMRYISKHYYGADIDFIFSHTCPKSFQPTDMFLSSIDQSTVDDKMEVWMDEIKDTVNWKIWCFGHYHADRIERPHVEQFFHDILPLDEVWNRWYGERTIEKEWWLVKSPNYYFNDNPYQKEILK